MVQQITTLHDLSEQLTIDYFLDDRFNSRARLAYVKAKQLTKPYNSRVTSAAKKRIQYVAGSLSIINGWSSHTWADKGHGLAGQSPTDYYFDMTLAKNKFMFFVYIHSGKVVSLNRPQQIWCAYAQDMDIPVFHWTIDSIQSIHNLLTLIQPTLEVAERIFPPPEIKLIQ